MIKPMLAAKLEDMGELHFPLFASPKLDGVRAMIINGRVMSRSLKEIPNAYVQELFGRPELEGLDGELVVGEPFAKNCMQATMSGVMSEDKRPDVTFWVFDYVDPPCFQVPWGKRFSTAMEAVIRASEHVKPVQQEIVTKQEELDLWEAHWLAQGYEGMMLRDPESPYKFGRCGKKAPWLIKCKRFDDAEALVVGAVERMHNDNEATTNELGRTKRSAHQENLRPAGDLGALVCKTPEGIQFQIGTGQGLTADLRVQLWAEHLAGKLVGRIAKYKHFAKAGVVEAPRHPVWLGFRDARDL